MIGANIAPGLMRKFDGEKWQLFNGEWEQERAAAREEIQEPCIVYASDIDKKALSAAGKNMDAAGVQLRLVPRRHPGLFEEGLFSADNPPVCGEAGAAAKCAGTISSDGGRAGRYRKKIYYYRRRPV